MTTAITVTQPAMPAQAHSDAHLLKLWLHGKSATTQRAYSADLDQFIRFTGVKPLAAVTLGDCQAFADWLEQNSLSANSRKRTLSAVKSLLSFGQKLGYLVFNVGAALKAPKTKDTLAARILTEEQTLSMIAFTKRRRDRVLLRLLYASAGRVSEVCQLTWADVQPNGDAVRHVEQRHLCGVAEFARRRQAKRSCVRKPEGRAA